MDRARPVEPFDARRGRPRPAAGCNEPAGAARATPGADATAVVYSAPTTVKDELTKMWCGQLTPIMCTLYSPLLSSATRLTVPPG
jgi:hypothetical protein